MLILHAEAVAGQTIEECVCDCIAMSKKLGCMIMIDFNDIPMIISNSELYGNTEAERVKTFVKQYHDRFKERELA